MAINLKRRRGTVSYKEPSSDDDFSQSSDAEHTPRKKRATPQRRSTRHKEPESERTSPKQSRQHAVTTNTTSINQSPNVRLRGKRRVSYRESSEEDNSDADFEVQEVTPSRERQRASISRASRTKKDRKPKSRPMKPLGAPLKAKKGKSEMFLREDTFLTMKQHRNPLLPRGKSSAMERFPPGRLCLIMSYYKSSSTPHTRSTTIT